MRRMNWCVRDGNTLTPGVAKSAAGRRRMGTGAMQHNGKAGVDARTSRSLSRVVTRPAMLRRRGLRAMSHSFASCLSEGWAGR